MTGKHFENFAGSIDELELLVESERAFTSAAVDAAFRHDAEAAVMRISEINQIANTRILTAAQIASAKAATDAEVAATTFSGLARAAVQRITARRQLVTGSPDQAAKVIRDTAELSHQVISNFASEAVQKINDEAANAIKQIKENGDNAIQQVMALVEEIDLEIAANTEAAAKKLGELKSRPRTTADISSNAAEAMTLLRYQFSGFSDRLKIITDNSRSEINTYTEEAITTISTATKSASTRIIQSRDTALNLIHQVVREQGLP